MIDSNILNESEIKTITDNKGIFHVVEWKKDVSVTPNTAQIAYFMSEMGCRKRQVVATLENQGCILQAGAMQAIVGDVQMNTNTKGVVDFTKKIISSKVTNESAIKPRYFGTGQVIFEPTYKHIILEDLSDWGGSIIIEDGLFLACDDNIELKVTSRSNLSSAVLGGEGLFNTTLIGEGTVVLESPVPSSELITFYLVDDVVKIDGNMAIAWSPSLKFTVERSSKTLVGSNIAKEGLVNVYRGTGKVMIMPLHK